MEDVAINHVELNATVPIFHQAAVNRDRAGGIHQWAYAVLVDILVEEQFQGCGVTTVDVNALQHPMFCTGSAQCQHRVSTGSAPSM